MNDKQFRAGAAASNITPRLGVSINGGMSDRTAEHIHDELHARCLVLDDGRRQIALAVCDSCMIPGAIVDAVRHLAHSHTGIPPDHMLVSATHTHTAPTVAGVFQSEPDAEYAAFLTRRIADGIRRAQKNLAPSRVAWGVAQEPSQLFNRRWRMKPGTKLPDPFGREDRVKMNPPRGSAELVEPAGPIDPAIVFLAVEQATGRPLALLANYSLHYVGDTGPGEISADYFGAFADRMQQLLGDRLDPPLVCILSNGTSGNINNIDFRRPGASEPPYTQIRRVAHLVADAVLAAYKRLEFRPWAELAMSEARLRLARRATPKDEVARAKFILSQAKGSVLSTLEEIYARETLLLAEYPPLVETVVQAIRIGELGIAASPCETFVETGLAIKAQSPLQPTCTISLANDYRGYLPTAEHHELGGYETWRARSSFLEVEAEARIRGKILGLLAEVASR